MDLIVERFANEKLVRDGIPRIIIEKGECCYVRHPTTKEEKLQLLILKIAEERDEYLAAEGFEGKQQELADVAEVILALGEFHGFTRHVFGLHSRRARLDHYRVRSNELVSYIQSLAEDKGAGTLLAIFDAWCQRLTRAHTIDDEEEIMETLAGLYEIVVALAFAWCASEGSLGYLIEKKHAERGGFTQFHVLKMP